MDDAPTPEEADRRFGQPHYGHGDDGDDMASTLGRKMDEAKDGPPEPTFLRLRLREDFGGSELRAPVMDDLIVETEDGRQIRGVRDVTLRLDETGYLVVELKLGMTFDLHAQLQEIALEPLSTSASLEKVAEQRNGARAAAGQLRVELQGAAIMQRRTELERDKALAQLKAERSRKGKRR